MVRGGLVIAVYSTKANQKICDGQHTSPDAYPLYVSSKKARGIRCLEIRKVRPMSCQHNSIEAAILSIQDTLSILHAPAAKFPIPPASLRLADRLVGETTAVRGGNLMR